MREFQVKHDKESLQLETDFTKLQSLERLMLLSANEFISVGKKRRAEEDFSQDDLIKKTPKMLLVSKG